MRASSRCSLSWHSFCQMGMLVYFLRSVHCYFISPFQCSIILEVGLRQKTRLLKCSLFSYASALMHKYIWIPFSTFLRSIDRYYSRSPQYPIVHALYISNIKFVQSNKNFLVWFCRRILKNNNLLEQIEMKWWKYILEFVKNPMKVSFK